MTLIVAVACPDGVAIAADSRAVVNANKQDGSRQEGITTIDNHRKLKVFRNRHYSVVVAASGTPIDETVLDKFNVSVCNQRLSISKFADRLAKHLERDGIGRGTSLVIAGWSVSGGTSIMVAKLGEGLQDATASGMNVWAEGDTRIASRIVFGYSDGMLGELKQELQLNPKQRAQLDEIAKKERKRCWIDGTQFTIQDCVDLAMNLVDTTIVIQSLAVTERNVGGYTDVVTVTPDGVKRLKPVQVVAIARSATRELVEVQSNNQ